MGAREPHVAPTLRDGPAKSAPRLDFQAAPGALPPHPPAFPTDAAAILACLDLSALPTRDAARGDEYDDLVALLLAHAAPSADTAEAYARRALAAAVARGCLGGNHLWQDLGLPSRQALSDLLARHFPGLHGANTQGMRWKKFFYLCLCEQADIRACRAPSCGVCVSHAECFGSEDGSVHRP